MQNRIKNPLHCFHELFKEILMLLDRRILNIFRFSCSIITTYNVGSWFGIFSVVQSCAKIVKLRTKAVFSVKSMLGTFYSTSYRFSLSLCLPLISL